MESFRPRRRVVEVLPFSPHLAEVAREICLHHRMRGNKDPLLDRVYAQLKIKVITTAAASCFFRYDEGRGKHWRGERYEYRDCALRLALPKRDSDLEERVGDPSAWVPVPGPEHLRAEDLMTGINLLMVQQILLG